MARERKRTPKQVNVETYLCRDCRHWGNNDSPYIDWKKCDEWQQECADTGYCYRAQPRIKPEENDE